MLGPDPGDLVPAETTVPDEATVEKWYCELASAILNNPGADTFQIAAVMKKSARWVSTIRSSDAFQEYFKRRYDRVVEGIQGKTATLVELAMDRLIDRVETVGDAMPTSDLHEIVDRGSKRLGYGSTAPTHLAVNVGVAVGRGDLEAARRRMQETFGVTTEAPATQLPPGTEAGNSAADRSAARSVAPTVPQINRATAQDAEEVK